MKVSPSDIESFKKEGLLIAASNSNQIWCCSPLTAGWSAQLRGSQYQVDGGSKECREMRSPDQIYNIYVKFKLLNINFIKEPDT